MLFHVLSLALATAWIPIFMRFLHAWKARKNPVSLAICATISFLIYRTIVPVLVELNLGTWAVADDLTMLFNGFVLLNFYVSFHWSAQRFPDARRRSGSTTAPSNVPKDLRE